MALNNNVNLEVFPPYLADKVSGMMNPKTPEPGRYNLYLSLMQMQVELEKALKVYDNDFRLKGGNIKR
jgi:hypothetical protein